MTLDEWKLKYFERTEFTVHQVNILARVLYNLENYVRVNAELLKGDLQADQKYWNRRK
jgi:hypothetical protein